MKYTEYSAYKSYCNMKRNCYPGNETTWYEIQGIKVCSEWLNDFERFLEDMGDRPSLNHKLCRKDTSKDFCKDNCTWRTKPFHRDIIYIEYNNERKTLKQWSEDLGVNYHTIYYRIRRNKYKKTPEEIIGEICQGLECKKY